MRHAQPRDDAVQGVRSRDGWRPPRRQPLVVEVGIQTSTEQELHHQGTDSPLVTAGVGERAYDLLGRTVGECLCGGAEPKPNTTSPPSGWNAMWRV